MNEWLDRVYAAAQADDQRTTLARSLCSRIFDERRSLDELRVLDFVLAGLEQGGDIYGPLDVSKDKRNFLREGAFELRDMIVYYAAHALAIEHTNGGAK
jgi:hypothetical protein